ncbi:SDR family oxidoreductase [Rhodothermus marinus]|uniref:SDR family oxidoreductase n=1 Tax=Rhodothermus marinus TaxID=29549 RepID=UPI0037C8F66D
MVLMVGATGLLGGRITQRLLARRLPVRMLMRPGSVAETLAAQGMATSPRALEAAGARPVTGDLKDPDTLEAACRGVEVVITTANSVLRGGEDTIETVDRTGNRNLIDVARRAGVRRLIFVSAQRADRNSPVPLLAAKGETEAYLQESGLDYTIVAPNAFMEVWLNLLVVWPLLEGRPPVIIGSGTRRHAFISIEDVADFVAATLCHPAARNRRLVIGGPEAYSLREVVAQAGQVLGRALSMQAVQPGDPVPGVPDNARSIAAGFDVADTSVEHMSELSKTFGVSLTPVTAFLQQALRPIARA